MITIASIKLKIKALLLILLLANSSLALAQENYYEENEMKRRHLISFSISHTHISQGLEENESTWLILPSYGIDYNFKISPMWSIGLHNDIIIESFSILKADGKTELERTRPFVSILTAGFKPGKHLTYQLGFGGEFAEEDHFFLTRIGLEYGWEISERMEFFTNLIYDVKWNNYNSYVIGLGVTRKL
ncbi:MAG: hypothetical protein ACI9UV_000052 [Algoriphagus sp.]|jgi:hypothetical protein